MADQTWRDATSSFLQDVKKLQAGQLAHLDSFTLHDGMLALELMDPKMDSSVGYKEDRSIKTLKQAIDCGLRVDDFSDGDRIGIMDDLLSFFMDFLCGNSLAHTVLTCVYTHDPSVLGDSVLKTFVQGILLLTKQMIDLANRACVHREEDFVPSTYGFALDYITVAQLNESCTAVLTSLRQDSPSEQAVGLRLRLVTAMVHMLQDLATPMRVGHAHRHLNEAIDLIQTAKQSLSLGTPKDDRAGVPKPFEPLINRHLLAPTAPRLLKSLSRDAAYDQLRHELTELVPSLSLCTINNYRELIGFFEAFAESSASAFCRICTFTILFPDAKLFGRLEPQKLIEADIVAFSSAPAIGSFTKGTDEHILLVQFYNLAAEVLIERCRMLCHNRGQQRRRLGKLLMKFQELLVVADAVDTKAPVLVDDPSVPAKNGAPVKKMLQRVSSWVVREAADVGLRFLLQGFALSLYSLEELPMIFWYCKLLTLWMAAMHSKAFGALRHHHAEALAAASAAAAKSGKKKKSKKLPAAPRPSSTWHFVDAMNCFCKACFKVVAATRKLERLPVFGSDQFSDESVVFQHRFSQFQCLESPAPATFAQYAEEVSADVPAQAQLEEAEKLFQDCGENAHMALALHDQGVRKEFVEKLEKVAKLNTVTCRLAKAGRFLVENGVAVDCSQHILLPQLKM